MGHSAEKNETPAEIIEFPGGENSGGTDRSDAEKAESTPVSKSLMSEISPEALKIAHKAFTNMSDDGPGLRMGDRLKAVREALGIDLAGLHKETLVNKTYLEAVESMYIGNVPKGMLTPILRTYANALQLPAEDVIRRYTAECGAVDTIETSAVPVQPTAKESSDGKGKSFVFAGLAATVALIGIAWGVMGFNRTVPADQSAPIIASVPAVNGGNESLFSETAPLAATRLPLALTAVSQGWIEVRGADGTIFRSRIMVAGETYHPRLGAGWTISAKDGGAFEWRVGGAVVGPLGPEGTPVYALSVDVVANDAAQSLTPAMAGAIEGQPIR